MLGVCLLFVGIVLINNGVCTLYQVDGKSFAVMNILIAWFSGFVAVNALIFGTVEGFLGSAALGLAPDIRWAAIWYLWALLWSTAFVEDVLGRKLGKGPDDLMIVRASFPVKPRRGPGYYAETALR